MHCTLTIRETADGFAARTAPARAPSCWAGTMTCLSVLQEASVIVTGAGLQPPHTATTLRRGADGQALIQDGPVAETKELLGALFATDVPDLDEALRWAAMFPDRPGLAVEVRPNVMQDQG